MVGYVELLVVVDDVESVLGDVDVLGTTRAAGVMESANTLINQMLEVEMIKDEHLMMMDLLLLAYGSEDATDQLTWGRHFLSFMEPYMDHQQHVDMLVGKLQHASGTPDAWLELLEGVAAEFIGSVIQRCDDQLMPLGREHNLHTAEQVLIANEIKSVLEKYNM